MQCNYLRGNVFHYGSAGCKDYFFVLSMKVGCGIITLERCIGQLVGAYALDLFKRPGFETMRGPFESDS